MCRGPACRQVQELEFSTSATAAFRWDERREQRNARVWNERDRGKRITPLPPLPQYWVVLVPLPRVLSTAAVYGKRNPSGLHLRRRRPQTLWQRRSAAHSHHRPVGTMHSPAPPARWHLRSQKHKRRYSRPALNKPTSSAAAPRFLPSAERKYRRVRLPLDSGAKGSLQRLPRSYAPVGLREKRARKVNF